jgi:hypothetical protein
MHMMKHMTASAKVTGMQGKSWLAGCKKLAAVRLSFSIARTLSIPWSLEPEDKQLESSAHTEEERRKNMEEGQGGLRRLQ